VRESWKTGPDPQTKAQGWRVLEDDDLLHWIESLPADHGQDRELVEIVGSSRHFFIRQEAAKRVCNAERLKDHPDDRHVGQILARRLSRVEDAHYLEHLVRTTRYLEVRKAAEAQLRHLRELLQAKAGADPSRHAR
jgi:hypothetical protein